MRDENHYMPNSVSYFETPDSDFNPSDTFDKQQFQFCWFHAFHIEQQSYML